MFKVNKVNMLINPGKSVTVNICKSTVVSENLIASDGIAIRSITPDGKIRYLGVIFSN